MTKKVFVKEMMKANPVTAEPFLTAFEVACLMRDKRVGIVNVTEQGHPLGIISGQDIIKQVICEKKNASEVTAEDIMNTPVVVIDPYRPVQEAWTIMERHHLEQLPIVEGNQLVGIVTKQDVFQMMPALTEIKQEWATINESREDSLPGQTYSGKCEDCDELSTSLKIVDGRLLCDDCIAGLKNE
ncbi:MAG TPA: CBS domain-containing protein [Candidatus Thermoplasmatota archaeon]|nr:CBS domain-containing protein [Candidatus Thermoplasmatota archaeon]